MNAKLVEVGEPCLVLFLTLDAKREVIEACPVLGEVVSGAVEVLLETQPGVSCCQNRLLLMLSLERWYQRLQAEDALIPLVARC